MVMAAESGDSHEEGIVATQLVDRRQVLRIEGEKITSVEELEKIEVIEVQFPDRIDYELKPVVHARADYARPAVASEMK